MTAMYCTVKELVKILEYFPSEAIVLVNDKPFGAADSFTGTEELDSKPVVNLFSIDKCE
jgi:hypothetical protein